MFEKLVAIDPVKLTDEGKENLKKYAKEVVLHVDSPADDAEIIRRIGDADAALLSFTSRINGDVIAACPNLRYIGMCCSLYSKESANVDIDAAEARGIRVAGIRDYGDRGVGEYAICELVRFLHGYDRPMWKDAPLEITGLNVGMVGLGVSGGMVAEALQSLGANIRYYCRGPKEKYEAMGMRYLPLKQVLSESDVVFACLNKNVLLLGPEEFEALGNGKILFNTSIGPAFAPADLRKWLDGGENYFACDTLGAIGDPTGELHSHPKVFCVNSCSGMTAQAYDLLSKKVLDNIRDFLGEE